MAGQTMCETWWTKIMASFERHHDAIIAVHSDADEEMGLVHTALVTIRETHLNLTPYKW
jgi:hypothetical protein